MKISGITKLLPLLLLLLAGCFWGDEYETRHLVGPYYLDETAVNSGAWYLHFEDEEFGLADALFNCTIVEAGYNQQCIIMRAACTTPQFYLLPITDERDREVVRHSIRGPLSKAQFDVELKNMCGEDLPHFDDNLTNVSK